MSYHKQKRINPFLDIPSRKICLRGPDAAFAQFDQQPSNQTVVAA
jgi:hypothetical protein